MPKLTEFVVIAIDGSRITAKLPSDILNKRAVKAPDWLIAKAGLSDLGARDWVLQPLSFRRPAIDTRDSVGGAGFLPALCLARSSLACASRAPADPRQSRLRDERIRLEELNADSDYVFAEPLDVLEGSEPERYRVTFFCRGIIGIDPATQTPIYGEKHEVEILCDDDFPSEPPRLRWITPIWHPNIQHDGYKGVCINAAEWLGAMRIYDLCRQMFEMVQYKNYHAMDSPPYPMDWHVAAWVRDYAEPNGIVKRGAISVDDKPFNRTDPRIMIRERPALRVSTTSSSGATVRVLRSTPTPTAMRIKVLDKV